jgi:2-oxoglutarate dehydrogenase E2 component (dihydrolipoamide succinyltransferase)
MIGVEEKTMGTALRMPQLGESVVEGTVGKWLKAEGETIEKYEPLLEVITDKVDSEITAPDTGTVLKIYVQEGETVPAGRLLAYIGTEGESYPEPASREATEIVAPHGAGLVPERIAAPASPTQPPAARIDTTGMRTSPVVARIAAENSVDLGAITGTGRGGRVTKKDILGYIAARDAAQPRGEDAAEIESAPSPSQAGVPGELVPLTPMRAAIAEHMVRSIRTSPHVSTIFEIDATRIREHRAAHDHDYTQLGVRLTLTPYIVLAAVAALKAVPIVNSTFADAGIQFKREINIGVAVALPEGLIVPVIKNADEKSLLGVAREVNDLAQRARDKRLTPDEVQGGTFTITNHGVSGSLIALPIINQPQAAILGVGAIQERVVVVGGDAIAVRPMAYLSLTFDHRILDGAVADQFMLVLKGALESWS